MSTDHRDPLHDSRHAMTEWERNLRPVRERHWAMWIALSVLILFGLYQGAEWLLAQQITPLPGRFDRHDGSPAARPESGRRNERPSAKGIEPEQRSPCRAAAVA